MSSRSAIVNRHRSVETSRHQGRTFSPDGSKTRKPGQRFRIFRQRFDTYSMFIPIIIGIPVLILFLYQVNFFATSEISTRPSSSSPDRVTNQDPRNPHEIPLQPNASSSDDRFASVRTVPQVAPRRALFRLVSGRTPLESLEQPFSPELLPVIHAVYVCETACCLSTIRASVIPLVEQTLPPTHLTFIESCTLEERDTFHHEARNALEDSKTSLTSYTLRPEVLFHSCFSRSDFQACVLDYFAHVSNTASTVSPHFVFVLTDRVLLEPTALEKAWLAIHRHSKVGGIRLQSYDFESLLHAETKSDPLLIQASWPQRNETLTNPVSPLPLLFNSSMYRVHTTDSYSDNSSNANWIPFLRTIGEARVLREPLYTPTQLQTSSSPPLFSLAGFQQNQLPPHLYSELAFFRWSAQNDEDDMYTSPIPSYKNVDMDRIPHWPIRSEGNPHVMLVLPWLQMGGSEKAMFDIASDLIQRGWGVSFVLTMPFWAEDPIGEVYPRHEWLNRAFHLTSDVFDLLNIAPDQKASKIFRYLLESRHPEYVLMSNSRWAYSHAAFIKAILPSVVLADYNHMIHMSWEGGGMPRFGANNTGFFDLHLTASNNVENAMRKWMDPLLLQSNPEKVKTCYIGTNSSLLHYEAERPAIRQNMRQKFGFSDSSVVVLFAGRFVVDKGIDVASEVVRIVAKDPLLSKKVSFIFVGSGNQKEILLNLPQKLGGSDATFVTVQPPATGLKELRDFYAMSDVFLLPSVNEGIALVVYEAMASGLLVITTDVGGQGELVTSETGILLPNFRSVSELANHTVESLRSVVVTPEKFSSVRQNAQDTVRANFTTSKFTSCVFENLERVALKVLESLANDSKSSTIQTRWVRHDVTRGLQIERYNGKWNKNVVSRSIDGLITVGIKTYVCDNAIVRQVEKLVQSIRVHHPKVRVLLGNDGPTELNEESFVRDDPYTEEVRLPEDCGISFGRNHMVNLTTTRYFVLLDDDHLFDDTTNLQTVVDGLRNDDFDIVGIRVRNLPGIDEYERTGVLIPRYVGLIRKLEGKDLTLCVWNENRGPSVYGIIHPIKVDVLHNAFVGKVETLRRHPWRNELKVNEHMTFFLDARDANLTIGYLPSVFVHHRAREYSDCYFKVRFREDKFRQLLRYRDAFLWDIKCGNDFPNRVKRHILVNELEGV